MEIESEYKIVKGKIQGTPFKVKKGLIHYRNTTFTEPEVKRLVDLVVLLKAQGYELAQERENIVNTGSINGSSYWVWGSTGDSE